mgnify:CR=1 FL=1
MAHDKHDGKHDIAETPSTLPAAADPRRRSLLKAGFGATLLPVCLLYTSPSPRD